MSAPAAGTRALCASPDFRIEGTDSAPSASAVENFTAEVRRSSAIIVNAALNEYPVEGSKSKAIAARRVVWYNQYQDSLPLARAQATVGMPASIATKLLSFLAEEWLKRLDALTGG